MNNISGNIAAIESKYPNNTINLLDAINDPMISSRLDTFYVPEVQVYNNNSVQSIFIKKDSSVGVSEEGPKRVRFIYFGANGQNKTNPDASFIQVGPKLEGFLARLSISRTNFVPYALTLDYLIDISKIKFRMESVIASEANKNIVRSEIIRFENIDFSQYQNISIAKEIREFSLNKEYFFEEYFR